MEQKEEGFATQRLAHEAQILTHEAQILTREVVTAPFRLKTYRLIRKILIGFILASLANFLFSYFFYTPKMYRILSDNRELTIRYRILQDRIRTAQRRVDEIRHRDNGVYRSLFATDTLSVPGVYLESVSFDELQLLSKNKEQMATAVPAIWPIDRKALHNNHIGAFNPRRFHPILHRIVAHEGIDLGCDRGTPVYATGDATVELAEGAGYNGGYGHQVLLNHEFGYKTRYAHLSDVLVKLGDKVKRGQIIARTGNTGRSSGPHLHYEVILKGTPVNPINYFNRNMSAEEYEELMENLRETNFEKY